MAEETNDKQQPAAVLLLVVVEKKKKEEEQLQQARAVPFVCYWALLNATMFAFSFAVDYMLSPLPCDHDPAEVVEEFDDAVEARCTLWSFVLQAAAATLALLLAGHRRKTRLALAYTALAAAAVCHCMFASLIGRFLAQDPAGHLLVRVGGTLDNFVFAGVDLLCLVGLLLAGRGDE